MASHGSTTDPPLKYALLLFPQFEVLDVFGPLECLNQIVRLTGFEDRKDLSLVILAKTERPVSSGPIKGDHDPFNVHVAQSIVPTHTFSNAQNNIDVLLVPGGCGTGPQMDSSFKPDVSAEVAFIAKVFPRLKYLITVCTGATSAAQTGVLDERAATTDKQAWKSVTDTGPRTYWVSHARWVVSANKKVWTTSGVSAGTDGFLAFLDHVYQPANWEGVDKCGDQICRAMEYTRVRSPQDDPWADVNGVEDVPPEAWYEARPEIIIEVDNKERRRRANLEAVGKHGSRRID